ncbi:hypothetical protein USDA257_c37060 [Sinorhizobium fredii USDA 257]|uniref:Uncharacterized protein n=1 Tax=Sinorhizobium fredii (strain USDA 257) TaxID=1185652 RepID=I3X8P9_SINF2|nr:hypothetical protein USDA257_c37060 [Sinorhizobium fredii USDA 257]
MQAPAIARPGLQPDRATMADGGRTAKRRILVSSSPASVDR